jgi:methylated-DNA-[protein]-cysteine S-methyltransferase
MIYCVLDSPIGPLTLTGDGTRLSGVYPAQHVRRPALPAEADADAYPDARRQLTSYFDGTRREFDLDLAPAGTDFQRRVWAELRRIPFGCTAQYGQIARRIGVPTAVRAVGAANGRNPLSIVVPCHRVIGADGALTGYAGGVAAKGWLLEHERSLVEQET